MKEPVTVRSNIGWRLGVIALVCFTTAKIGLLFVVPSEGIATIWLAGGVALAALLLSPRHEWRVILATIFLVNTFAHLTSGNSLAVSIGFGLANTVEPGVGAWLMVRLLSKPVTFARAVDVLGLIGAATLANALTALLGALTPTLALNASYWSAWQIWWVTHGLGYYSLHPSSSPGAPPSNLLNPFPRRVSSRVWRSRSERWRRVGVSFCPAE